MPLSSLVIHLGADPTLQASACAALAANPAFSIGDPSRRLLPAALDSASEEENKACWGWLNSLPGVEFVEVLSVCFSPAAPASARTTS